MKLLVERRPRKLGDHLPWVILIDAHPKPIVAARCETEEEARDRAEIIGGQS